MSDLQNILNCSSLLIWLATQREVKQTVHETSIETFIKQFVTMFHHPRTSSMLQEVQNICYLNLIGHSLNSLSHKSYLFIYLQCQFIVLCFLAGKKNKKTDGIRSKCYRLVLYCSISTRYNAEPILKQYKTNNYNGICNFWRIFYLFIRDQR